MDFSSSPLPEGKEGKNKFPYKYESRFAIVLRQTYLEDDILRHLASQSKITK